MKKQQKVLVDHKTQGKRLVPPLLTLGNLKETSYIDFVVPEIIWIAILIEKYGIQRGTEIGLEIVKAASKVAINSSFLFSFISSYETLKPSEKQEIVESLESSNVLVLIQGGLENFISVYPECPLNFLFNEPTQENFHIQEIKNTLITLYDKVGITSTFSMGNVIYYMGVLGRLNVVKGSSIAQLPRLIEYPNTQLSKLIASSIRATIYTLIQQPFYNKINKWNKYFWNRGHELEPSKIV